MQEFAKLKPTQKSVGLDIAGMSSRGVLSIISAVSSELALIDHGNKRPNFRIDNLTSKADRGFAKPNQPLNPRDLVLYGGVEQALSLVSTIGESFPQHGDRQKLGSSFQSLIKAVNELTLSRFLADLAQ